jgi:NhaP-type Na+/H+ or K+/H+ antiporter
MTWALATIAVLLVAYAAFSRRLQLRSVSSAMFFTTAGLLTGPVLGLVDLRLESEQVKLLAEITLTLVLLADASRISLPALRREFALPPRLLGIGLPLTIAVGTLVGGPGHPRDQRGGGACPRRRARDRRPPRHGGVLGRLGPRGLASIVFAVILIDDADLPHLRVLVLAIAATIALSVHIHGLAANPLTERHVRWWTSHPRDARPAMESVPAAEHRTGPEG